MRALRPVEERLGCGERLDCQGAMWGRGWCSGSKLWGKGMGVLVRQCGERIGVLVRYCGKKDECFVKDM